MKPARILLLAVAVVAGGLAAFLATRGGPETTVAMVEPTREPSVHVLVANQNIGVGQRLNPALVEWQAWPQSALRPEYVTETNMPDAIEQLVGTVARFEIFPGEPVREAKLVRSDQGYLSAVLTKGMRGVSLPVTAESSAGGFIVPNDRVDVVHTVRNGSADASTGSQSTTILQNVKVLAIGVRLGETGTTGAGNAEDPQANVFKDRSIATLELTPLQAEAIIGAERSGELSLVLRSVSDFAEKVSGATSNGKTVHLIRFGVESQVQPAAGPSLEMDAATVEPANYDASVPPIFNQNAQNEGAAQ